jgi:hypothetical protein
MASRLFLFAGQAVTPANSTWVISFETKVSGGGSYREITDSKQFATYEEAVAYLKTQPGANARLVGLNPFASCVPLEPLKDYKLVYESPWTLFSPTEAPHPLLTPTARLPQIRIFEYVKPQG